MAEPVQTAGLSTPEEREAFANEERRGWFGGEPISEAETVTVAANPPVAEVPPTPALAAAINGIVQAAQSPEEEPMTAEAAEVQTAANPPVVKVVMHCPECREEYEAVRSEGELKCSACLMEHVKFVNLVEGPAPKAAPAKAPRKPRQRKSK